VSGARDLPAVHRLVAHPRLAGALARHGPALVTDAVREVLAEARQAALVGGRADDTDRLAERVEHRLDAWLAPRPRRVVNATGVILHTNLGRAPLSEAATRAMAEASAGYSDLEYDLASGERGSRHDLAAATLCRLTGAEAALVVNNNAGATLLVLSALAQGRGVLVARGQLVEIGGGFRVPAVMAAGGARLVEVGTTNRTYLDDYRAALDEQTALLLRVHASNYRITGFTHEVALADLVELGQAAGLPVVDDLGSGSLLDTRRFGLAHEPLVQDSVAAGAALVTFSGDKLLGGPQAGLIVGRRAAVERLRRHPLTRALRPGKDVLAALHATLLHYLVGEAERAVPVWRMIGLPASAIAERAAGWCAALAARGAPVAVRAGASTIGGGSLPGETLPTTLLALAVPAPEACLAALRAPAVPVVARIEAGEVVLDPRTVAPEEEPALVATVAEALHRTGVLQ
jgi:L-seryl-tRNA(Ser) seleniumtransferase